MKKVLICGVTGFMGINIAKSFLDLNEYEVYGVGNSRFIYDLKDYEKFYKCDLTTKEGIAEVFDKKYDIVIQAAATTSGAKDIIERPYLHVTDNAVMNSLILQACYDTDVDHFLFLSCGVMYNPDRTPVKEADHFLDERMPENYFGVGWTKVYIEKMCEFFASLNRTKHTCIRHSNTYGPYDKYDLEKSHMFGATIAKVMNAKNNDEIIVWGDGSTERDLIYVDDVVEFIHLAIKYQNSKYDLFNVGLGKSYSVNEIVQKIINYSGKHLTAKNDITKPTINTKLALNSAKAEMRFGWKPSHSIDEGIQKTIRWYKDNVMKTKGIKE